MSRYDPPPQDRASEERSESIGDEEVDDTTALTSQTLNADGTPKRPMNAFMIFARRRRPQLSAENQQMRTGEISKILSKEWQAMGGADKQFYLDQAKHLKDRFNAKYPEYVYRRRPNNSRKKRRPDSVPDSASGASVDDWERGGNGWQRQGSGYPTPSSAPPHGSSSSSGNSYPPSSSAGFFGSSSSGGGGSSHHPHHHSSSYSNAYQPPRIPSYDSRPASTYPSSSSSSSSYPSTALTSFLRDAPAPASSYSRDPTFPPSSSFLRDTHHLPPGIYPPTQRGGYSGGSSHTPPPHGGANAGPYWREK